MGIFYLGTEFQVFSFRRLNSLMLYETCILNNHYFQYMTYRQQFLREVKNQFQKKARKKLLQTLSSSMDYWEKVDISRGKL